MNRLVDIPHSEFRGPHSSVLLSPRETLALLEIGLEDGPPPSRASNDSQALSEIVYLEKQRALLLALAILNLLVAAVIIYIATL